MEYTALYRQFRPLKFEEIVGQEHITKTLKNQIIAERVGHAYLFNGGRGTGKTSAAKVLARAINCENPQNGEPCNECEICKQSLSGALTDIIEMDAASNNGVDDIRKIREEVNFLPTLAKYKIYIIDEVHMLSSGAFNALLKTLEEPPKHVKFILATTEPQKVPVTILSRCQRFNFKKISSDNIVKRLKYVCDESKISISDQALKIISVLSEGAMRDALSILERCIQDGDKNIEEDKVKELVGIPSLIYTNKIVRSIIEYNVENALQTIEDVSNEGKEIDIFIWEMIKYVKDILLYKTSKSLEIYSKEEIIQISELCEKISKERLLKIIYELSALENDVKHSSQKMIMFQAGIIRLCTNIIDKNSENQKSTVNNDYGNGTFRNSENNSSSEEMLLKIKNIEMVIKKIVNGDIHIKTKNVENSISKTITNENEQNSEDINQEGHFSSSKIISNVNSQENIQKDHTKIEQNVNNFKGNEINKIQKTSNDTGVFGEWKDILGDLNMENKKILYSYLRDTDANVLNDMTVGINFKNGFNAMSKIMLEKPENVAELEKRVSMKMCKPMKIKYMETPKKQDVQDNDFESLVKSLDIPINIMD